jgi:hypothetical protein
MSTDMKQNFGNRTVLQSLKVPVFQEPADTFQTAMPCVANTEDFAFQLNTRKQNEPKKSYSIMSLLVLPLSYHFVISFKYMLRTNKHSTSIDIQSSTVPATKKVL